MAREPLVSIVIPTLNSEKTLPLTLESIKKQTYKNIEVIVVDSYSRDNTVKIAKKYGARVIQIYGERARAKNEGLRSSKGKYVLFIDSDMELTPRVVEECVEVAETGPNVVGVVIPEKSVGTSYWVKVRDFERSFYAKTFVESPRFFRRDVALQVGGFDEDIVFYEEATLPIKLEKLGYNVRARINSYIIHHEESFSLLWWLKKKYYYGKTVKLYKSRYKGYSSMQISPVYRFGLFFKNKRFWKKPSLAIGVIILKILEYLATGLGYVVSQVE